MTKGKWFARALHVTIALSFILGALVVAPSVSADPGTSKWETQGTPTEADKVILPGSDIIDFDVTGSDGMTIYAIGTWQAQSEACLGADYVGYAKMAGPGELWGTWQIAKLWKSEDGGVTWSDKTSKVLDAKNLPDVGTSTLNWDDFMFFTAVSAAPDDPDFVVVTGWDSKLNPVVVGSNDGASKFYYMGCSTVSGYITCVDVSMEVDDKHVIAVGTWDPADTTYAGNLATVWRYDAGGYWSSYWVQTGATTAVATGYTGWDPCDAIVDLEFSPNFDVDDSIVVLCIDEVNDTDVDAPFDDSDADSTLDYLGFKLQAGTWDSIDAWNGAAEFDSYPVVIKNDDYSIVSPLDPTIGSGWSIGPLVRHAGDIDLPMDYMGDDNSDRKVMAVVNGVEFNMASTPADEWIDDGGFLFWVENTTISLEMLNHEDNPYIASLDYQGNIDMEGRTLLGLAFPSSWRYEEIMGWFNSGNPAIGCCNGVQVLRSETTDVCCPDWDYACKPPTGQFFATVMMTPDGDLAFAGTQGESRLASGPTDTTGWWSDESAFSISDADVAELGKSWNQESLIDTDIDFISDVAVTTNGDGDDQCSPSCNCLYIATINEVGTRSTEYKVCECDSIWRSCDGGSTWLRIWNKALQGHPMGSTIEWMELGLVPGEEEAETIYMADIGTETIWVSNDGGSACCPAGLGCWTDRNTGLEAIADFAVLDDSTLYVVDFNGDLVKSTTSARHWSSIVDSEVNDDTGEEAHDIIAMGDWVVLGGDKGTVSYSDDGGDSFSVLDDIGDGEVHVAFDSYFDDNGYIYAAIALGGTDNGIYRTTIDDADFKSMDACTGLDYWGIVVSDGDGNPKTSSSTGGVLYASYNGSDACAYSGVARLLNPASSSCCGAMSWDYLFENLYANAEFVNQPTDLEICGDASGGASTLWAIDVPIARSLGIAGSIPAETGYYNGWDGTCYTKFSDKNVGRLWKYNDVFGKGGPVLIGVEDGATIPSDPCDCVNEDFVLEWDRLCDACEYDIEIALDEGFTHKVWSTSTICAMGGWSSAGCQLHDACGEGVLIGGTDACESAMTFYKPSDPCIPSIVVPKATLDCNQQYWWRVRARVAETGEIYRSWWSDKWSFTVAVGPGGAIKLTAPDDGASNVPLENIVFTWTAVADATSYEFTLMDASGAEVASNSGDATSFVLGSKLDYDSPYMWQVNAMMGSNVISESGTSTFRTMSEPTAPPEIPETVINFPEPVTGTPTWVWVVIALAAILIIVVIVLIFRTRRV